MPRPVRASRSAFPPGRGLSGLGGAAVLAGTLAGCGPPPETDLEALWAGALPFEEAVAGYGGGGDAWRETRAGVEIPAAVTDRLAPLPGRWRLLVVAEAWCIDSQEAVPWLDGLAEALPGVELRVTDSRTGAHLLERFRTPDGREATPTMAILSEDGSEAGCWVERPAAVQDWWSGGGQELDRGERLAAKADWWRRDRGYHLLTEVAGLLEAAAAGTPMCGRPSEPRAALPEPGWPSPLPLTEGAP